MPSGRCLRRAIDVSIASPLGYQTPAEFYAPAYATEKARRSMVPDYRTTLYWNPTVKLDDTGQATVEFYTSDARLITTSSRASRKRGNRLPAVDGHGRLSGKAAVGRRAVCPFGQRNLLGFSGGRERRCRPPENRSRGGRSGKSPQIGKPDQREV